MKFKTGKLNIKGPINYKTQVIHFCCKQMKRAIYKAEYVYNSYGVQKWGDYRYIDKCPYCGGE